MNYPTGVALAIVLSITVILSIPYHSIDITTYSYSQKIASNTCNLGCSISIRFDITCRGTSTGTIGARVVGSSCSDTYEWSIDGFATAGQSSSRFQNLPAGDYTITVRDPLDPSCISSCDVTLSEPTTPCNAFTAHHSNSVCNNLENLLIIDSITGGDEPYTFEWEDGSSGNTLLLPAVTMDTTIQLMLADSTCCRDTITIMLTSTFCVEPVCNIEPIFLSCGFETSYLKETGGDAVLWDWGNGDVEESAWGVFVPASGGTFTVTITDDMGARTSCSIQNNLIACNNTACPDPLPPGCSDGAFNWVGDLDPTGQVWTIDDSTNTYTVNSVNGPVNVNVALIDPDNRNGDNDQYTTHPFDPAGGCNPYPGASGGTETDNVPGNGSIIDPWDSDCNYIITETSGTFGANFLTFGINTEDHNEDVTLEFIFDKPILLNNFCLSDIDAVGIGSAMSLGRSQYEAPGNSYQDEVILSAITTCGNPATFSYCGGSLLNVIGDTIKAANFIELSLDLQPTDEKTTLYVSSQEAITSLSLTYSNGYNDAISEQVLPSMYEWWSDTNGATNGASDDQAIRVGGFDFCCCPEMTAELLSSEICNNQASAIEVDPTSPTGGTGPYNFEWPDGTTGESYTLTSNSDTTIDLLIYDAVCCVDTIPLALTAIDCAAVCPNPNCFEIAIIRN